MRGWRRVAWTGCGREWGDSGTETGGDDRSREGVGGEGKEEKQVAGKDEV